jgi:hypothetical protein
MTTSLQTIINSVHQTVYENVLANLEEIGIDRDEAIKLVNEIDSAEVLNLSDF